MSGGRKSYSIYSEEDAWYNAMTEMYINNNITVDEITNNYYTYSQRDIITNSCIKTTNEEYESNNLYIHLDLNFDMYHSETLFDHLPLKQLKVEIYENNWINDILLATSYTNENGEVNFVIQDIQNIVDDDFNIYAKVYAESHTFKITSDWDLLDVPDFYFTFDICSDVSFNYVSISKTLMYKEGNKAHSAFIMTQGLELAQRYALERGMQVNDKLLILYPINLENITSFCYGEFSGIITSHYDDYQTLIHEYGHFIQHIYNAYGSSLLEIVLNDPRHLLLEDHFSCGDHLTDNFAMELAWSEAWAFTFSEIVQSKYFDEIYIEDKHMTYIKDFGDCVFINSDDGNELIENFIADNNSCEAQEIAIISLLWDLFDSEDTMWYDPETQDNVELEHDDWWYFTLNPGVTTFHNFFDFVQLNYSNYIFDISQLIAYHNIAAYITYVNNINISETIVPSVQFNLGGSENSKNVKFTVLLCNSSFYPLFESELFYFNDTESVTVTNFITLNEWTTFLNRFIHNFTFYVVVKSYNESNLNQWYYSNFWKVDFIFEEHICDYSARYEKYNSTHHKSICSCGNEALHIHRVHPQGIQRFKPCIYCGYLIDTENTIIGVNPFNLTDDFDPNLINKNKEDINEEVDYETEI